MTARVSVQVLKSQFYKFERAFWKSFQDWPIYVFSSKDTCTSSTSIFKMYSLRQLDYIIFIAARVWFISDLLPCFLANLISFLLDKALADLYSIILQVGWRFGRKKNQSGIFFLHFFFGGGNLFFTARYYTIAGPISLQIKRCYKPRNVWWD